MIWHRAVASLSEPAGLRDFAPVLLPRRSLLGLGRRDQRTWLGQHARPNDKGRVALNELDAGQLLDVFKLRLEAFFFGADAGETMGGGGGEKRGRGV